MEFPQLVQGRFLRRENRFRAAVEVAGRIATAHVPNSGRLNELFTPRRTVWLAPASNPGRVTAYDLKLVDDRSVLVSVDSRIPNALFKETLLSGKLAEIDPLWSAFHQIEPEIARGESRLDFRLKGPGGVCWVETKSVTLVVGGRARFPDAPTTRGRKHLETLMDVIRTGGRAVVVFMVQRPDATAFEPHPIADPDFNQTLRRAASVGVQIRAYICRVSLEEMTIDRKIPVNLLSAEGGGG
jgi:sugar fermentation stimulation protein A